MATYRDARHPAFESCLPIYERNVIRVFDESPNNQSNSETVLVEICLPVNRFVKRSSIFCYALLFEGVAVAAYERALSCK